MAIIALSTNQALNPGADLWVVPDFAHSKMSLTIDWYNNFIFGKTLRKKTQNKSNELEEIINETELELVSPKTSSQSPVMISSQVSLPNRWTVMVPFQENSKSWSEEIYKLYFNLKKPTMRIFLPTNLSINEFIESWRLVSSDEDFSIVVEN